MRGEIYMKNKKGISLIVLIVTIIVIIILTSIIILTLTKNNPIVNAKEATFKSDVTNINDELSMYIAKKYTDNNGNYDPTTLNLSGTTMVSELPSTKKYITKLKVESGVLMCTDEANENEIKWFYSVVKKIIPEDWQKNIADITYENVPIPKGFTYVEGTKSTGVVIQDNIGNEFVWIPVDGTDIKYDKDFSFPSIYSATSINTSDDSMPNGIVDENLDVIKYRGFYIARYEAGVPDGETTVDGKSVNTSNIAGVPTSKKGKYPLKNINYLNAKANAESMYKNSEFIRSGLLTGKAWDTTCKWIQKSGKSLDDSVLYGNYYDSTFNYIDLTKTSILKSSSSYIIIPTGSTEYTNTNNIYDLDGNVWEWTYERNSSYSTPYMIYRGGRCNDGGVMYPISYRSQVLSNSTGNNLGFRVRLYILQ